MEMQVKMEKKTIEDDVATENVNVELPQIAKQIQKQKQKKKKKRAYNRQFTNYSETTVENITFCNTVGLRGVFVLLLVLGCKIRHMHLDFR